MYHVRSALDQNIRNTRTASNTVATYVIESTWKYFDNDLYDSIQSHLDEVDNWKSKQTQYLNVVMLHT